MGQGQVQTVPQVLLEKKLGKKLQLGEEFTTPVGTWKVIQIARDGHDTYTLEQIR